MSWVKILCRKIYIFSLLFPLFSRVFSLLRLAPSPYSDKTASFRLWSENSRPFRWILLVVVQKKATKSPFVVLLLDFLLGGFRMPFLIVYTLNFKNSLLHIVLHSVMTFIKKLFFFIFFFFLFFIINTGS